MIEILVLLAYCIIGFIVTVTWYYFSDYDWEILSVPVGLVWPILIIFLPLWMIGHALNYIFTKLNIDEKITEYENILAAAKKRRMDRKLGIVKEDSQEADQKGS